MADTRREQLQKVYQDHEAGFAFAETIERLVAEGTEQSLAEGVQRVRDYYEQELEAHLQQEEQTLFAPLLRHDQSHFALFAKLGKDHGFLRMLGANLGAETAERDLTAFAQTLKEHTRIEDEQLLPLVEALFTEAELERVLNFTPLPTAPVQPRR